MFNGRDFHVAPLHQHMWSQDRTSLIWLNYNAGYASACAHSPLYEDLFSNHAATYLHDA